MAIIHKAKTVDVWENDRYVGSGSRALCSSRKGGYMLARHWSRVTCQSCHKIAKKGKYADKGLTCAAK